MIKAVQVALNHERCPTSFKLMEQDDDYYKLVKSLWERGEQFIICEHDVIPWPGSIAQIDECEHPWCTFWYRSPVGWLERGLGLVKFDPSKLPNIFEKPFTQTHWRNLDIQIGSRLKIHGLEPHTHSPAVTNLNPLMTVSPKMQPKLMEAT